MYGIEEHNDFHYSTDAEWDTAAAYEMGADNTEAAWILTDRDVWHKNPHYNGPDVPHPEMENYLTDVEADELSTLADDTLPAELAASIGDDDIPF